jgi:hypothetical protein
MGRSAHGGGRRPTPIIDCVGESALMPNDPSALFEEISELLAAPRAGDGAPPLAHVEDTLTAGYARALALEAERWRIERRLGEVAAKLRDDKSELKTDEIAALATRLSDADGELTRLRGLLATLRTRASDLRVSDAAR